MLPWWSIAELLLASGTQCPVSCGWLNINKGVISAPNSLQSQLKTRPNDRYTQGMWRVQEKEKKKKIKKKERTQVWHGN